MPATNQFVTYADTTYINAAVFGPEHGMGGFMVWHMGMTIILPPQGRIQVPLSTALYNATVGSASSTPGHCPANNFCYYCASNIATSIGYHNMGYGRNQLFLADWRNFQLWLSYGPE